MKPEDSEMDYVDARHEGAQGEFEQQVARRSKKIIQDIASKLDASFEETDKKLGDEVRANTAKRLNAAIDSIRRQQGVDLVRQAAERAFWDIRQ